MAPANALVPGTNEAQDRCLLDDQNLNATEAALSWRSHQLYVVATVAIVSLTDIFIYSSVLPVLPSILGEMGVQAKDVAFYISAILAIQTGSSTVLGPLCGWLADRGNTRKVPILAALVLYIFSAVGFLSGQAVSHLLVCKILQGVSSAIIWSAGFAMCVDVVGPEKAGITFGTVLGVNDLGSLLAPPIGGLLYVRFGKISLMAAAVLILVISMLCLLLVQESEFPARRARTLKYERLRENSSQDETSPLIASTPPMDEERAKLLETQDRITYTIEPVDDSWVRTVPILACFKNPALFAVISVCIVQAALLGVFDATVTLEALDLFALTPEKAGLLFMSIGITKTACGSLGGWSVDRFGPRLVGILGHAVLTPILLMSYFIRSEPRTLMIVLYVVHLALAGAGIAWVGTVSFVESSRIVERYHSVNPHLFGTKGPYASVYSLTLMVVNLGMTIGSFGAGNLRAIIGYGNTLAIFAVMTTIAAVVCGRFMDKGHAQMA